MGHHRPPARPASPSSSSRRVVTAAPAGASRTARPTHPIAGIPNTLVSAAAPASSPVSTTVRRDTSPVTIQVAPTTTAPVSVTSSASLLTLPTMWVSCGTAATSRPAVVPVRDPPTRVPAQNASHGRGSPSSRANSRRRWIPAVHDVPRVARPGTTRSRASTAP